MRHCKTYLIFLCVIYEESGVGIAVVHAVKLHGFLYLFFLSRYLPFARDEFLIARANKVFLRRFLYVEAASVGADASVGVEWLSITHPFQTVSRIQGD